MADGSFLWSAYFGEFTPESQNVVTTPVYALFFLEELLILSSNSTKVILHLKFQLFITVLSRYHTRGTATVC